MKDLENIKNLNPPLFSNLITQIIECIEFKKWFELGNYFIELLQLDGIIGEKINLYKNLIINYNNFFNKLHLSEIIILVSLEFSTSNSAINFLNEQINNIKQNSEFIILLELKIIHFKILNGDFETSFNDLNKIFLKINEQTHITIRSTYYKTLSELDKARGDYDSYYLNILLYLSISQITFNVVIAFDLCKSILISNNFYSFQEITIHPIINSLNNTDNEWIKDLIFLIDKGSPNSLKEFNEFFIPKILNNKLF